MSPLWSGESHDYFRRLADFVCSQPIENFGLSHTDCCVSKVGNCRQEQPCFTKLSWIWPKSRAIRIVHSISARYRIRYCSVEFSYLTDILRLPYQLWFKLGNFVNQ